MEINGVAFKEPSSGGGTNAAESSLADTFDTFLALLTTQLQNQDPLDPMKSEQFTQQLVQFAGVEQAINTNKKLDQLVQLQTANQLSDAVSFMGKVVEVAGDKLVMSDGTARIGYSLARNAKQATINIFDQVGRPVRTINGETAVGRQELVWDGRDSNGAQLPDGVYGFSITATDGDDQTVDARAASFGRVTGVGIVEGVATFSIGDLDVPFDAVMAVREDEADG